ncbi:hypothetical protein BZG02_13565 [Labilibaculum filiforme]|uniref:Uncharacterized protein n=1 Tax=Labilibaculum filiforme TaxID=1940526 RepID=A0A2N3HWB5_9BACT|nr:hypothetical protein [Labilibaculum filiforme]PKQ62331.1 hypothetical protein BZG02_13565 [Labilibaculum filiforme]
MANALDDLLGDAKKKGSEIWSSIKSTGKDKLKNAIQNLNDALPEIEEAGFVLVRLDVDIALLPRLFARFKQEHTISLEDRESILKKTKKNKFLNFILIGLFKASDIKNEISIDNIDLKEIELEIGLTPSAKLIFRREERLSLMEKNDDQ